MLGEIATSGLVNVGWIYGFFGVFLAFAVFVYNVTRNTSKDMGNKADRTEMVRIEEDMKACEKTKATIAYVDDKTGALHRRINESNAKSEKQFELLLDEIRLNRKAIKDTK